jgi:hypothetical protein
MRACNLIEMTSNNRPLLRPLRHVVFGVAALAEMIQSFAKAFPAKIFGASKLAKSKH